MLFCMLEADLLILVCMDYGYKDWENDTSVGCLETYNTTSVMYTDMTVENGINRQWFWFLCNEPLFYWQT